MISVIMSAYNEPIACIKEAIESILNQTYRDIEYIIVCDNPARDDIKKMLLEYKLTDSRVKLIFNDNNLGLPQSLNKAISIATGEYIARMDAGDISNIQRLEVQFKYLNTNNLDIVGSEVCLISDQGEEVCSLSNPYRSPKCVNKTLLVRNCLPHPTWLVRTNVYQSLHMYRDVFACEDYDFLLRARERGYGIGIADSVLLKCRISPEGISQRNALRQVLTAFYLSSHHSKIDTISIEDINTYINTRINDRQSRLYGIASSKFYTVLNDLKSRKYLAVIQLIVLPFISRYILINYYQIIAGMVLKCFC